MKCPTCEKELCPLKRTKIKVNPFLNNAMYYFCNSCNNLFYIRNIWIVILLFLISLFCFLFFIKQYSSLFVLLILIVSYFNRAVFLTLDKTSDISTFTFITPSDNYSYDDMYHELLDSISKLSFSEKIFILAFGIGIFWLINQLL